MKLDKCVILVHGFGRTSKSMKKLETGFVEKGFDVFNWSYSTKQTTIIDIAYKLFPLYKIQKKRYDKVYFVTHSLGGIIVRCMLKVFDIYALDGIVMIAPPNGGSSYVKCLIKSDIINYLMSPILKELSDKDHINQICKDPKVNLMVIAGTKNLTINNPNSWISQFMISTPNDGTITVRETILARMDKFSTVVSNHTIIMKDPIVINRSIEFLESR
jgi:esterase/lipase